MTQLPIPVHVGSEPSEYWDDIETRQSELGENAAPWLRNQRRPSVAWPDFDWAGLGFEPRWVGSDTAACAAARQPSVYGGQGADEFDRFRRGVQSRGEIAMVISLIGNAQDELRNIRNVFGPPASSVSIGRTHTSISGRLLGKDAKVRLAADIGDADVDLARRLLNLDPAPRWSTLSLLGAVMESVYGREEHAAEGVLIPVLETELGEPVVAAWVSPDGVERRYVVPEGTPWAVLLQWLQDRGIPEFVPGAMCRARRQPGSS